MNRNFEELQAQLANDLCSVINNNRAEPGLFSDLLETMRAIYYLDGQDSMNLSVVLMLEYVYHELIAPSQIAQIYKDIARALVVYHISRLADGKDHQDDAGYIESDVREGFDIG